MTDETTTATPSVKKRLESFLERFRHAHDTNTPRKLDEVKELEAIAADVPE